MKRYLLFITFSSSLLSALAQPTIQRSQYDISKAARYNYLQESYNVEPLDPGKAGENIVWDFSNLKHTGLANYIAVPCDVDDDCKKVPEANVTVTSGNPNGGNFTKKILNQSATEVLDLGSITPASGLLTYDDPMKQLQFPMVYDQVFKDEFSGERSYYTVAGTISSHIDGYGTLITPTGTYKNALRQKVVIEMTTTLPNNQKSTVVTTQYLWYVANVAYNIMGITIAEERGKLLGRAASYTTSGPNNIDAIEDVKNTIVIYPNPAQNQLSINAGQALIERVEIVNVLGQNVYSLSFNEYQKSEVSLPVFNLANGYYQVKTTTDKGVIMTPVTIQR